MIDIEAFKKYDLSNIDNKDNKNNQNNDNQNNQKYINYKEIIRIEPENLYKKYININSDYYVNLHNINFEGGEEKGDLFAVLDKFSINYKIINKLIFNLDEYVIRNLYRYIWTKYKLLKIHLESQNKIKGDQEYYKSPIFKYINTFQILHSSDYNSEIFGSYYNFVYNNLYTDNITLCVFFYNTICKYLIN